MGLRTFVGRRKELEELREFVQPIFDGKSAGLKYVSGETGIGKTRLLYEFKILCRDERGRFPNWLSCPADEILRQPLNPFRQFLRKYFKVSFAQEDSENKRLFALGMDRLISDTPNPALQSDLERGRSFLGALMGLYWPESLYEELDPQLRFENTLNALECLFKAEAIRNPAVIELDDAHWLDAESIEFINRLTRNLVDYPIAIVILYRTGEAGESVSFEPEGNEIELRPFTRDEVQEFAEKILSDRTNPEMVDQLVVWTDGNPFFIEQVILFLQEENLLKRGPQGVMRIEQSQVIPGDVRAVLIARLDRLSMRIKQTVQAASILGQEFELYVLSQVMKSSATLVDDVRTAEQEAIWMTIAEMRYIFKHALMRDTVYDMQLQSQRRVLHKLAAESYEKLFADNLVPHYSEIAYHYEMANIIDGALTYWEKAGLYNKSNYHNRLAMTYFDKIITVLGEILNDLDEGKSPEELSLPPEWSRTWIIEKITEISLFKGQILEVIGEWEGASALYRDLLPYAEILGDILKTAKIYRQLGWIAHLKGDNSKAMEHLQASLSMSLEGGDEAGIGITTGKMGYIHHYLGNYDMAMSCFEKDLELSTKIDNQLGVSIALNNIGNVYRRLNDFGKAMECYERKLDLNTVMRDRKGICVAFGNIGSIHFEQGSYDKAMSCYERCLDISEEIGDKLMISIALFKIGTIHQIKGDAPRAISYYEKRLNISRVLGDKKGIERTLGAMGKIRARQGEIPEALDSFDQAIGICREQGIRNDLAEYLIEKANLVLGQGDWGGAAKLLEEGREIAESINHRETLSQCRLLASRLAEIRNAESARA